MVPAEFLLDAIEELEQAQRWYEEREPGLGEEFVRAVRAVVSFAQRHPEAYPVVHQDLRRGVVRRFPFGVIYRVLEDRLVVFAIFHSARDPQALQNRSDSQA